MAITGVSSFGSTYENVYSSQQQETGVSNQKKTNEAKGNSEIKAKNANKSSNEEYLKSLQKQVPYIKLQAGNGINVRNDGKVNVVDVNPKLLEKMQNDPEAAKEYTQRLKDVEAAMKFGDNFSKSMGHTVVCSHGYIDENGKFSYFAVVVKKDLINEKLRKEAQENAEKQIEKSRENARKKAEQLADKIEEKIEETREDEKKQEKADASETKTETARDKAENLLLEKLENSDGGEVYLDNEDIQLIVEAAKQSVSSKNSIQVGENFDLKI